MRAASVEANVQALRRANTRAVHTVTDRERYFVGSLIQRHERTIGDLLSACRALDMFLEQPTCTLSPADRLAARTANTQIIRDKIPALRAEASALRAALKLERPS